MAAIIDRPVVLIGMMGVGKTTVGRRVAERLGRPFVDLDQYVSDAEGMPVAELFATVGEEGFRDVETRALQMVLSGAGKPVVAAGGGVVLRDANRALLASTARVIWLEAPVGVLVERVGVDPDRPLSGQASPSDPSSSFERLLDERRPLYDEVAHARIDADGAIEAVADAIVDVVVGEISR